MGCAIKHTARGGPGETPGLWVVMYLAAGRNYAQHVAMRSMYLAAGRNYAQHVAMRSMYLAAGRNYAEGMFRNGSTASGFVSVITMVRPECRRSSKPVVPSQM